jgi:ATP-dependent exoDNAse (exonuclease V) alpha subunit
MVYAHYRLETKIVGRQAKGQNKQPIPGKSVSVVAKAAYRSGQSLKDDRADKTFNYRSRTQEVAFSEIMAPENAPDWLRAENSPGFAGAKKQREQRQQLWNTIERVEKRKDSQLAREFVLSLPRQLDRAQQIELVRDWCAAEFVSKGFVVDLAIHKSKSGLNPHAHVLVTTRPVTVDGFGKKPDTAGKFNGRGAAGYGVKDDLMNWRESWCNAENSALEKAGRPERADHRSLKARGIDKIPEPKIGVEATAMQRRGLDLDPRRHQFVRWVKMLNEARPHIRNLKAFGRTLAKPSRSLWLQRSADYLSQFGEKAGRVLHDAKDKWTMMVDSQRANVQKSGPDLER